MSISVYPSLPSATSIRLFHLAPGTLHEPIAGCLEVVDLKNEPDYECVSYTWGDASDEEAILVDGEKVLIRRHLWEALRRMRLPTEPRALWIDALCISQSDLDEKAKQVHMIGKIVSLASSVLAWLGEHADGSEAIFHGWSAQDTITVDIPLESIPRSLWTRRLKIWLAFCSRRWFSRTWIIQEIVVAKEVHVFCGKDAGRWTILFEDAVTRAKANERFYDNLWAVLDGVEGVSSVDLYNKATALLSGDLLRRYNASVHFLTDLVDMRRRYRDKDYFGGPGGLAFQWFTSNAVASKCLDRRDKIYALRSIIYGPDAEPGHGIPVDYTVNMAELLIQSVDSGIFYGTYPYLARDLIQLLELSEDEVETAVNRIANQPSLVNKARVTLLAYVCITDTRTPKEVTSKLLDLREGSSIWLYEDIWQPGCAEKLLKWHSLRKAGGDMYSLLEDASTSDP